MTRVYLHPLPLRIWHWINMLLVVGLMTTGFYLRQQGIASLAPRDPFLLWHKGMGLATMATTVFWFVCTMSLKEMRRHYRIEISDLRGGIGQMKFYLVSIFGGAANPFTPSAGNKYNPLQKIAYDTVMFIFMPVQIMTGLVFFNSPWQRYLLQQELIGWVSATHVLLTYLFVLYLIVHLYMATLGETVFSHTRTMIVGYEEHAQQETEADLPQDAKMPEKVQSLAADIAEDVK